MICIRLKKNYFSEKYDNISKGNANECPWGENALEIKILIFGKNIFFILYV